MSPEQMRRAASLLDAAPSAYERVPGEHAALARLLREQAEAMEPAYDPTFGDKRVCKCGHPYYRHFDTYENMAPVGCKYCDCYEFEPAEDALPPPPEGGK